MTNPMNSLGNTAGGEQVEIANATSTNASLVSNLQATITPYFDVEFDEKDPSADEHIKNMVLHNMADNEQLHQAHIILMEKNGKGARLFEGIDKCYLLLQNSPDEKIVLLSMFPLSMVKSYLQGTSGDKELLYKFSILMNHSKFKFMDLLLDVDKWKDIRFDEIKDVDTDVIYQSKLGLAQKHIGTLRHMLEPYKISDPYNPKNDAEENTINMAFDKCKEYFPGLDTKQKMLDYVFNTKLDIPEVMKGQNIEGVYCDVDGTLLIGGEQEETQILNKKVVSMLKGHETEGKQITIWTGGDLEKAQTLLKSLGIDWPVVSKYDYAGAIAEIVVDNEDEGAFVLQYKIAPKTFINANNI